MEGAASVELVDPGLTPNQVPYRRGQTVSDIEKGPTVGVEALVVGFPNHGGDKSCLPAEMFVAAASDSGRKAVARKDFGILGRHRGPSG